MSYIEKLLSSENLTEHSRLENFIAYAFPDSQGGHQNKIFSLIKDGKKDERMLTSMYHAFYWEDPASPFRLEYYSNEDIQTLFDHLKSLEPEIDWSYQVQNSHCFWWSSMAQSHETMAKLIGDSFLTQTIEKHLGADNKAIEFIKRKNIHSMFGTAPIGKSPQLYSSFATQLENPLLQQKDKLFFSYLGSVLFPQYRPKAYELISDDAKLSIAKGLSKLAKDQTKDNTMIFLSHFLSLKSTPTDMLSQILENIPDAAPNFHAILSRHVDLEPVKNNAQDFDGQFMTQKKGLESFVQAFLLKSQTAMQAQRIIPKAL